MTQWKNNLDLPDEPMLIVRRCYMHMCWKIRPGAKLLSVLLYHARYEQGDIFMIGRTQEEMADHDMCEEITEKTLADTAIPALVLFGFIDIDMSSRTYQYTLHLDRVRAAIAAYKESPATLELLLKSYVSQSLEKLLITEWTLEEVLMILRRSSNEHKKKFLSLLEKVLKNIRNSSNARRGRKPKTEAALDGVSENTENLEIDRETKRDKRDDSVDAPRIDTPAELVYQIEGYGAYYHDFCVHAQDRGINDGLTFKLIRLEDVPQDAHCDICYARVHDAPDLSFGSHDGYTTPTEKGATDGAATRSDADNSPGQEQEQVVRGMALLGRDVPGETEALEPATPKQPFEPPGIVRLPSKSPNQSVDTDTMPSQQQIGATNGLDRYTSPGDLLRAAPGGIPDSGDRASDADQGHVAFSTVTPQIGVTDEHVDGSRRIHSPSSLLGLDNVPTQQGGLTPSQQTPASVQPPDHVIPPNDMTASGQAIEVTLAYEGGQATTAERPTAPSGEGDSADVAAGAQQQIRSDPPVDPPSLSNTSRAAKARARSADTSVPVFPPPQADQAGPGAVEPSQQTDLFGEPEQKTGKGKRSKGTQAESPGPPQIPPLDAPWNDETGVQIVEAINKRRYSETTRKQELQEMKKICAMVYNDGKITRRQFELAWQEMISWSFWSERNIKPMIKHLRKDDKILNILETMERKSKPRAAMNGNGAHPPVSVSGRRRLDLDDDPPISTRYTTRSIPHA